MKVYTSLEAFQKKDNAVVTTGTFDGVHIGHQKIVNRLNEVAQQIQGESVILTFFPHPRLVLFPEDNDLKLINTLDEKIALLEQAEIGHLVIIPFTKEFSRLSSLEFIQKILVDTIGTKKLVIGYDHHFGKNREGTFNHLKHYAPEYGFEVEEIPEQDVNDIAVSSTKIRNALLEGDIHTANQYLGYPFMLTGKVIKGDQIGRTIGFPTANVQIIKSYKLIPADGIYAAQASLKSGVYKGMLYIGNRPTIDGMDKKIEINLFGFNEDIYDESIQIELIQFVRGDLKLNSLEELTAQIREDEIAIKKILT